MKKIISSENLISKSWHDVPVGIDYTVRSIVSPVPVQYNPAAVSIDTLMRVGDKTEDPRIGQSFNHIDRFDLIDQQSCFDSNLKVIEDKLSDAINKSNEPEVVEPSSTEQPVTA